MCINPKLDIVIINAYMKFDENISSSSQDLERKRNFGVNKGPLLWYKFGENDVLDHVNINAHTKFG